MPITKANMAMKSLPEVEEHRGDSISSVVSVSRLEGLFVIPRKVEMRIVHSADPVIVDLGRRELGHESEVEKLNPFFGSGKYCYIVIS